MGPIDMKTLDGVCVKLGAIGSFMYIMERSFSAAMAEHFSGELSRLSDLFYILWGEVEEIAEAVDKINGYSGGLNPIQAEEQAREMAKEAKRVKNC